MSRLSKMLAVSLCVLGLGSDKVLAKRAGVEVVCSPDGSLLAVGSPTQLMLYTLPSLLEARALPVSPPVAGQSHYKGSGDKTLVR